jgi:hypothetical protein
MAALSPDVEIQGRVDGGEAYADAIVVLRAPPEAAR